MMFDVEATRRLSIGLFAASGAVLFAALNLIAAGISSNNHSFVVKVSKAIWPLAYGAGFSMLGLICAELAGHPKTPQHGHPHSTINYLQSAFVFVGLNGLGGLCIGTFKLLSAAVPAA